MYVYAYVYACIVMSIDLTLLNHSYLPSDLLKLHYVGNLCVYSLYVMHVCFNNVFLYF